MSASVEGLRRRFAAVVAIAIIMQLATYVHMSCRIYSLEKENQQLRSNNDELRNDKGDTRSDLEDAHSDLERVRRNTYEIRERIRELQGEHP